MYLHWLQMLIFHWHVLYKIQYHTHKLHFSRRVLSSICYYNPVTKGTDICNLQLWVLKHRHRNLNNYFSSCYNKFLVKIMKYVSSICGVWDSHSSAAEDSSLLVCDNVSLCKWFPTFQRTRYLRIQGSSPLVLQNSENHSPSGIAEYINLLPFSCSCKTIVHIFVIILPLVTWMY